LHKKGLYDKYKAQITKRTKNNLSGPNSRKSMRSFTMATLQHTSCNSEEQHVTSKAYEIHTRYYLWLSCPN